VRWIHGIWGDVALAVVVTWIAVAGTIGANSADHADRGLDAWGIALVVLSGSLVAVRRVAPAEVAVASAILTGTYLALGYTYGPVLLPFIIVIYTVSRHRSLQVVVPVCVFALGCLIVHLFTTTMALDGALGLIPASAWVIVPFAVGTTVRTTRSSAERARADAIKRRVVDERLRVAQEVHDVVGHGLAAISLQANVALHVLPKDPTQAQTALESISRTSAQALEELRATLVDMRRTDGSAPRSVVPGLDGIEGLCARMRSAGAQIEVTVTGGPRTVPDDIGLAGYRVVQESLTNVLRHGDVPTAAVRVGYGADQVSLTITNPTRTLPVGPAEGGLGLPGMRERVEALGGRFSAGHTSDGHFEVVAVIPTPKDDA
jgi:signal transduction histidine kinase